LIQLVYYLVYLFKLLVFPFDEDFSHPDIFNGHPVIDWYVALRNIFPQDIPQ